MSYEKLGFEPGQVLMAEHLNHIEKGVEDLFLGRTHYEEVVKIESTVASGGVAFSGVGVGYIGTDRKKYFHDGAYFIIRIGEDMTQVDSNDLNLDSGKISVGDISVSYVRRVDNKTRLYTYTLTCSDTSEEIYMSYNYSIVHTIDEKYLPDSIKGATSWNDLSDKPFGDDELSDGDIIFFDTQNIDGLVCVPWTETSNMYKISDIIPTEDDLAQGFYGISEYETNEGYIISTQDDGIYTSCFAVAYCDNAQIKDGDGFTITFAEKGFYVLLGEDSSAAFHTIGINGYTGFPKVPVTKTLDAKYLPKASAVYEAYDSEEVVWQFNALLESLREAGYLQR